MRQLTVWVPPKGERFHESEACASRGLEPDESTLGAAIDDAIRPCGRCVGEPTRAAWHYIDGE